MPLMSGRDMHFQVRLKRSDSMDGPRNKSVPVVTAISAATLAAEIKSMKGKFTDWDTENHTNTVYQHSTTGNNFHRNAVHAKTNVKDISIYKKQTWT